MDNIFETLLLFVVGFAGFVATLWVLSKPKTPLERWAEKNGYQLLQNERWPWFWAEGPFDKMREGDTTHRIIVLDKQGNRKSGWAHCHGLLPWWFSKVKVKWDEQFQQEHHPPLKSRTGERIRRNNV